MGGEFVFPGVSDSKYDPGQPTENSFITSFALWFLDPITGRSRTVTAPFFVTSRYGSASKCKWQVLNAEDGTLIGVLMMRGSYDFRYYFFTYDGTNWSQIHPQSSTRPQLFIFSEETAKVWDEPGEVSKPSYMLVGGSLAISGDPLTFAVDFTHAFAYDSGPMTPTSSEYSMTLERAKHAPKPGIQGTRISLATKQEMVALLPAYHRVHEEKWSDVHCWFFEIPGGLLIADWDHGRALHSVVCFDTSS